MRYQVRIASATWILLGAVSVSTAQDGTAVVAIGSERMVPMMKTLAAAFHDHQPVSPLRIEVRGGELLASVKALAEGRADMVLLARPPSNEEYRLVRDKARAPLVCVPIALDAVVIGVHPENPLEALSLDQLRMVFTHEISDWNTLGVSLSPTPGHDHTPDCALEHPAQAAIRRYAPPAHSGPRGVFQDRVMGKAAFTSALQEKPSTVAVVAGVRQDPLALGLVGFGETSALRAIALSDAGGSDPVFPTPGNIRSRAYPLAHYVYVAFAGEPDRDLKAFLAFALSPAGQEIVRVCDAGFLPVLDDARRE